MCKCDCGNVVEVPAESLVNGASKSCGCYNREIITKHNKSMTNLYQVWQCMKDRCFNPNHVQYKDYGGRGITVCDEWSDPDAFCEWALSNGYSKGLSIDRIDVNGNYEPSNCRWATQKEQCRNRRNNAVLEYNGEKHCLTEWAEIVGTKASTLATRRKRGWPTRDIIFGRPQ